MLMYYVKWMGRLTVCVLKGKKKDDFEIVYKTNITFTVTVSLHSREKIDFIAVFAVF